MTLGLSDGGDIDYEINVKALEDYLIEHGEKAQFILKNELEILKRRVDYYYKKTEFKSND